MTATLLKRTRNKKPKSAVTEMGTKLNLKLEYSTMNILTQNNQQSMTSQQIADLVGKRHDNVRRTIQTLAISGVIRLPQIEDVKNHQGQTVRVDVFSGEQGKRDSLVVVAQLSPEFTGALVDRWQELEAQASSPVITLPQDYLSALKALVNSEEEKQVVQAQIQILQPKAAALDTLSHAKGSLGIPEREFVKRCLGENKPTSSRFLYRDDKGRLNAHAHRIKQGFMTQKLGSYVDGDGHDFATVQVKFTAAGVAHIAKLMQNKPSGQLRVV